jgi:hypothetical protein
LFKAQDAARAASYAFSTSDALAMLDWLTSPGVFAYVNPDRTVVGTDPTLHAARGIWYHLSRRKNGMLIGILFEKFQKNHINTIIRAGNYDIDSL